ncbi:hypothetical protein N7454_008147 [Penicillium verhagenii]|nr:hypothetical protein N7454_008147 [Penicillium verhagenii]
MPTLTKKMLQKIFKIGGLHSKSKNPQMANSVDSPPPYCSDQPRDNGFVSAVENERHRRKIEKQADDAADRLDIQQHRLDIQLETLHGDKLAPSDHLLHGQLCLDAAHSLNEMAQILTEMGNLLQSRKPEHVELYETVSRLNDDDLDRILQASSKQDKMP